MPQYTIICYLCSWFRRNNWQVKIGHQLVNLIMYADDIVLMTETREEMEILINAITEYGH